MTGGAVAVDEGLIVVLTRLNRILEIDTDNLVAHVEPGVITGDFQAAVEAKGLFYPPDPSSLAFSTLGGNLAECAGGPRAVKYGVTRDYVLGVEAVLPTGERISTGVQTTKGVVGYDLTRLLIGSEGTLAIITRITFRLLPLPEATGTMAVFFSSIDTAANAVSAIIRKAIIPRTIEFMDEASLECVSPLTGFSIPGNAKALLLIEVDGSKADVDTTVPRLRNLCRNLGAIECREARTKAETDALWKARKELSPALFQYGPDKINEDIVVPRSKIPLVVKRIGELQRATGLTMVSFGHAGDGNIHFNIMLDKRDSKALAKAEQAVETLFDYTLALGGTISGEHGIGLTKAPYLSKEIGVVELELMGKIKGVFDPKNILNPGKMFQSPED